MPDQNTSLEERVQLLHHQLQHIEQVLVQVRRQVAAVQNEMESERQKAAGAASSKPAAEVLATAAPALPQPFPARPTWPFEAKAREPRRDWEAIIGGNWFNKIGIGAIILGMAFFLRYAIENEWIGDRGKVLLGIIVGLLLLAGGERYHRRQLKIFARGLTGGGAAILYLSLYFAFQIYQIISQPIAFVLMALVTATTVALALRYNSRTILLFAMFGGFFTPFWVSTGVARPLALFTYIAILDLGLVAVAWRKDWPFANTLCFAATAALYFGWYAGEYHAAQFWLAETFLTIFYLIFAALAFFIHLMRRQRAQISDALAIAGNALFYFTGNLALLDSISAEKFHGAFTAGMALLYGAFSFVAWRRHREDQLLSYLLMGAAITFLTLFFPIEFKADWVPLAWLVETLVLINLGAYLQLEQLQRLGLMVGIVAWVALYRYVSEHHGLPIQAGEWLTFFLGTAGVLISNVLPSRKTGNTTADLSQWLVLGEVLTLLTLPFLLATAWTSAALLLIGAVLLLCARSPLTLAHAARITVFYFAPLATFIIFIREYDPEWINAQNFMVVLNSRFLLYVAAAGVLGWHLISTKKWASPNLSPTLAAWLMRLEHVQIIALLFFALTLEVFDFYDFRAQAAGHAGSFDAPKQLTLSAVWSIFSLLLLIMGIWKRVFQLRMAALLILAITIIKVAFVDFWLFEKIYRILSALVFGGILVYASYLYQRHKDKIIAAVMGKEAESAEN